ncbi:hypothetical protein PRIPAC_73011 [Pristionchus pacificus]|uniref:Uncharacterized protein n=1 Tax=Pristionchus pacificus TaxID=54126 RepID=A0A2A6BS29_PRIPA|nr:hypothetical protein PRIPAC_73011 [Pristionchus pacificus]|eukprot:PDM68561.1 hypothetical protein PRIPAC_44063 [Pristionchus pacificus]
MNHNSITVSKMRLAYFLLVPLSFVLVYVTVRLIYLEMDPFGMNENPRNRCPPGGVWSEWVTTGACPTTCGGCADAERVRTCTTLCGDCPCEGPSSDIGPCGLSLCPFPSKVGTCCKPFKKSLNYQSRQFFCGPGNVQAYQCAP